MKFKINYDGENRKLYISPALGIALAVGLAFLALIIVGLFLLARWNVQLTTPEEEKEPITVLGKAPKNTLGKGTSAADIMEAEIKKEYGNKFTIIFFYDGYENQQDALGKIDILKESLNIVEPYKSLKDLIAFKIFTTEGEKCQVKSDREKILVCDPQMIEGFQRLGIEHFKLVILSPKQFVSGAIMGRGVNSWITVSTFKSLPDTDYKRWLGFAFTRELGHSLGLRSEFTDGKMGKFPEFIPPTADEYKNGSFSAGEPNCAPDLKTAQKWWGSYVGIFPKVGFFPGCAGNKNYFYPQEDTLMSDKPDKESYGQVSEDYLRAVISCFYANKELPIFGAGEEATYSATLKTCDIFRKQFPKFWEE